LNIFFIQKYKDGVGLLLLNKAELSMAPFNVRNKEKKSLFILSVNMLSQSAGRLGEIDFWRFIVVFFCFLTHFYKLTFIFTHDIKGRRETKRLAREPFFADLTSLDSACPSTTR
jgi:hypothetical protein